MPSLIDLYFRLKDELKSSQMDLKRHFCGITLLGSYWLAKRSGIDLLVANGANSLEAAGVYLMMSANDKISRPVAGFATIGFASACELGQYIGFHGTYDSRDFVAYGLGVLAAEGASRMASRKKTSSLDERLESLSAT